MTVKRPIFSVVLCFFNEERFLEEAIQSVLAQDCADWELILVDDGSDDYSTVLAKRYATHYGDRIKYVHHPGHCNQGLAASRNLGVEHTRGEYIAFLDADDAWLPGKLASLQLVITANPEATVVIEGAIQWTSWSQDGGADCFAPVGADTGLYECPGLFPKLYPFGNGAAPCASAIVARRSVFEHCAFEESFQGIFQPFGDHAFLGQAYLRERVFVSRACNTLHRQHSASILHEVISEGRYAMVIRYFLQWMDQYVRYHNIRHRAVRAAVRRALLPFNKPVPIPNYGAMA